MWSGQFVQSSVLGDLVLFESCMFVLLRPVHAQKCTGWHVELLHDKKSEQRIFLTFERQFALNRLRTLYCKAAGWKRRY